MDLHLNGKLALVTASSGGIGSPSPAPSRPKGRGSSSTAVASAVDKAVGELRNAVPARISRRWRRTTGRPRGARSRCGVSGGGHPGQQPRHLRGGRLLRRDGRGLVAAVRGQHHERRAASAGTTCGRCSTGDRAVLFIASESASARRPRWPTTAPPRRCNSRSPASLAELTKGTRVTVNTVLPGSTMTEGGQKFVRDVFPGLSPADAERQFMRENRPTSLIERLIDPTEVADFVAFLCSPRAARSTGRRCGWTAASSGVSPVQGSLIRGPRHAGREAASAR